MIPQLREWHQKYGANGLVIVGVHTPEFFWEKSRERVQTMVKNLGIHYAVVQDNDSRNWNRFGVRAWPTLMLIDKKGILRYRRIGEGGYEEIESWIRRLLAVKS